MTFQELLLPGAFLITFEKHVDERGYFARTFCKNEFEKRGLCSDFKQDSLSFNAKEGTVRGMHFQRPVPEVKIVQCLKGKIFDVIVDIRKESATYGKWLSVILSGEELQALYIPAGFAHGFQTLEDNTLLQYKISEYYVAGTAQGIRWNDPLLNVTWPRAVSCISSRDVSLPCFADL